jgi:hypothetical protein
MTKSNKSSKSEKGCVGFVSGGVLKQGHIRLISSDSCDPEEVIQEYVKYYGDSVKLKYVPVENASDYLEKFAEKLEESDDKSRLDENFFHFGSVDAATILREVTDAKSAKKYSVKKNDDDDKSGDEDDKKPAKKPAKKSSKKKEDSEDDKDDKDEDKSDGEKSDEEDKKSKKKEAKKPAKKSSKKKEESENEDEKDDSEDEGEKLKKSTKGGKGKSKSK